jgi:hypothetical protein
LATVEDYAGELAGAASDIEPTATSRYGDPSKDLIGDKPAPSADIGLVGTSARP